MEAKTHRPVSRPIVVHTQRHTQRCMGKNDDRLLYAFVFKTKYNLHKTGIEITKFIYHPLYSHCLLQPVLHKHYNF